MGLVRNPVTRNRALMMAPVLLAGRESADADTGLEYHIKAC